MLQADPPVITLSAEFPCLSYAQRFSPSADWFIGFNACALHDHDGELHWEDTLTVEAQMWDAGTRDGEPPYMDTRTPRRPSAG